MNKLLTSILFSTAVLTVSNAANAYDGTVNFTGTITTDACTVSTVSPIAVEMGTYSVASLQAAGDRAGGKSFSIELTSCPDQPIAINFQANSPVGSPDLIALTASGSEADNVGIALMDNAGNDVSLNTGAASSPAVTPTAGAVTFEYIAVYEATGTSTAGDANATANFTVTYQ